MNGDQIEIRYYSPKIGYATEVFTDTSPQGAMNVIRSRVPDAQFNTMKQRPAAVPPARTDEHWGSKR